MPDHMPSRIEGWAYRERATLDISGDTLTWRASTGRQPENIVTTVFDVRFARVAKLRVSRAALAITALGVLWMIRESVLVGAGVVAFAIALAVWRWLHPRLFLVLEVRDHQMVLKIEPAAVPGAQALVTRIERAIASGEVPDSPPALP